MIDKLSAERSGQFDRVETLNRDPIGCANVKKGVNPGNSESQGSSLPPSSMGEAPPPPPWHHATVFGLDRVLTYDYDTHALD